MDVVYLDEMFGEPDCPELIVRYATAARMATMGTTIVTFRVETVARLKLNLRWKSSRRA